MGWNISILATCGLIVALSVPAVVQRAEAQATPAPTDDAVRALVGRLDLEKYKATIKGLTQFGDRRQGTDRNRAAVDWIEAQLKSYGCTNTERIKYTYDSPPRPPQPAATTARATAIASGEIRPGTGGSRMRGLALPTIPNNDPDAQTDPMLRALNSGAPSTPGPREEVLRLVPSDAGFCLFVSDLRGQLDRIHRSPFAKALAQSPVGKALVSEPEIRLRRH
jgi:hypothetical protein